MGLDLTIISNHHFKERLESVKDNVIKQLEFPYHDAELSNFFRTVTRKDSFREWEPNSWTFDLMGLESLEEAIETDKCICFKGPWAISLRLGRKSYQLDFNLRWYVFLENNLIRERIFTLMDKINSVLRSEMNIYIPDKGTRSSGYSDLITENYDLEHIMVKMKKELGPPCMSMEQLIFQFTENENAYLIKQKNAL